MHITHYSVCKRIKLCVKGDWQSSVRPGTQQFELTKLDANSVLFQAGRAGREQ